MERQLLKTEFQKQPQVWGALEIKLFVSYNISWSVLEESSFFQRALMLSCVVLQRVRCLVQDTGTICWCRLAVCGVSLCFPPWRFSGEAEMQPVLPVMSLNISLAVGSASFSLWDAEIGSVLKDSVSSETQIHLLLPRVTRQSWTAFSEAVWL